MGLILFTVAVSDAPYLSRQMAAFGIDFRRSG
jgi:hypothetical protein